MPELVGGCGASGTTRRCPGGYLKKPVICIIHVSTSRITEERGEDQEFLGIAAQLSCIGSSTFCQPAALAPGSAHNGLRGSLEDTSMDAGGASHLRTA